MTDKKPNEYVKGQFRRLMEAIESDISKQDKIVDEACIAIDSAYEQGKLDEAKRIAEAYVKEDIGYYSGQDIHIWLKSQIKEVGD